MFMYFVCYKITSCFTSNSHFYIETLFNDVARTLSIVAKWSVLLTQFSLFKGY